MEYLISHIKAIYKLYDKTDMYFLAGEYYDVICTEKLILLIIIINIIISVHITSYSHIQQLKNPYL
jgi:hypothetical protein